VDLAVDYFDACDVVYFFHENTRQLDGFTCADRAITLAMFLQVRLSSVANR